ncbi:hypothetical protein BH11ACT7_BH11ACT7_35760 [soil metagenome]
MSGPNSPGPDSGSESGNNRDGNDRDSSDRDDKPIHEDGLTQDFGAEYSPKDPAPSEFPSPAYSAPEA